MNFFADGPSSLSRDMVGYLVIIMCQYICYYKMVNEFLVGNVFQVLEIAEKNYVAWAI